MCRVDGEPGSLETFETDRKVHVMEHDGTYKDVSATVEAFGWWLSPSGMEFEYDSEDFINYEAVIGKLEFKDYDIANHGRYGKRQEDEVFISFYNADETRRAFATITDEADNYSFWVDVAKKSATIEGFTLEEGDDFNEIVLRVKKVRVHQ